MKEFRLAVFILSQLSSFDAWAAAPSLSIEQLPSRSIRLSWAGDATGFTLEQSDQLGSLVNWQTVAETPQNTGGTTSVSIRPLSATRFYRLRSAGTALPAIVETSPANGESTVAVTRETIFHLSAPLSPNAVVTTQDLFAEFGARRLLSRAELSSDRRTLTLFYLENLPASARIVVTLDGTDLGLDADGDGQPGGIFEMSFDTLGITGLQGTAVIGQVFASEKQAGTNMPLANVTVTVDGAEETLRTTTDSTGFFRLSPAPAGTFFVHVDGRTANGSHWPGGAYYPFVGKAWEAVPGRTNNLAGGSGEIFLPLIQGDALQPVNSATETRITFAPSVLATNPALSGVEIMVPANSLFSDNGTRGGKVGIAPVPADRLPGPLPPGLNFPLVITIQTDGASNFDVPVPVRFPNLPGPISGLKLPPGAKTALWSFNHDTGRWEIQGSMTISADGLFAVSDPGVGVRQPGWHGAGAGSGGSGPSGGGFGGPRPCDPADPDCPCEQEIRCRVSVRPGNHYLYCALLCLGNLWDREADDEKRSPLDSGLRCIGGPDKCPGNPDDVLSKKETDCADDCDKTKERWKTFVMPCEGFEYPCTNALPPSVGSLRAAASAEPAAPVKDRVEEQFFFWRVQQEYLVALAGTPKIIENAVEEFPVIGAFFDRFSTFVGSQSENGIHLSAAERTELIGMSRPSQFTAAEWVTLIDRWDSFQGADLPAPVVLAGQRLDLAINLLKSRGWKYRLDGLFQGYSKVARSDAPALGSSEFPARSHYFYLKNHHTHFVQRGRLSANGTFEGIVLTPENYYTVAYYDPVAGSGGAAFFKSRAIGETTQILTAPLEPLTPDLADEDGDSLPDVVELILGTNSSAADTDSDGVPDGQEVFAGQNPLDGVPAALGVINSIATAGKAVDVTAWNNLAAVADSAAGVALFDVKNPRAPVKLVQISTPGNAVGVAGGGALLAVASPGGVAIFDVSVPASPVLGGQVPLGDNVRAVAVLNGLVVAALNGGDLVLLNEFGDILQRLPVSSDPIQDMIVAGGVIYVYGLRGLAVPGQIYPVTLSGQMLTKHAATGSSGAIGAGGRRPRLASDGSRLFVAHTEGFNAFDLAIPLAPVAIHETFTAQRGWKQMASDGSGLGLAAVGLNSTDDGPHDVSLYTLGANGGGTNFLTTFTTPGLAEAVAFHRGVGFVADGTAGLSVVEYANADTAKQPPTVTMKGTFNPGPAQLSGLPFHVTANAQDDVRMRNVDFLLNGVVLATDGNPPFEADLVAPTFSPTNTSFVLQTRAIDTAGAVTLSAPITVPLAPDVVAPAFTGITPAGGSHVAALSFKQIVLTFSERLHPASVNTSAFNLVQIENGQTSSVPVTVTLAPNGWRVFVNFTARQDSENLRVLQLSATPGITDLAGNSLAAILRADFHLTPVDRLLGGTSWNLAENWKSGELPSVTTPVLFGTPGAPRFVQVKEGNAFTLVSHDDLTIDGPLNVVDTAIFNGKLSFVNQSSLTAGGEVSFFGGVDARVENGGVSLKTPVAHNFGTLVLDKSVDAPFTLIGASLLRNEPNALVELHRGTILFNQGGGFQNHGKIAQTGLETSLIIGPNFQNFGEVSVLAGQLELLGGSENFGVTTISHGATLSLGNAALYGISAAGTRHIFTASSRLEGAGLLQVRASQVQFNGPVDFNGSIRFDTSRGALAFNGVTRLRQALDLSGETSVFPPVKGNEIAFGGLSAQIDQLVKMGTNSTLTFNQLTPAVVPGIDAQQSSQITGNGVAVVKGHSVLNSATIGGRGVLQFDGSAHVANLTVAGAALPAAPKPVIFNGPVRIGNTNGSSDFHSFNQAFVRIETNGVFDIVRNGRFANGGVTAGNFWLENRGILRHSASNLTQLELRNSVNGGFSSGSVTNWGTMEFLAGELRVPGVIQSSGLTVIKGGHLNGNARIEGGVFRLENGQYTGDLTFAGGQAEFPNGAVLPGAMRVSAGELTLPPQTLSVASFFQTNGTLRLSGGTLVVLGASEVNQTGVLTGFGTIQGSLDMRGSFSPGSPIGTVNITQAYNHNSSARLVIDIGGTNPGIEYDQLKVADLSISNGTLEIRLINGFNPPLGAEFQIIIASGNRAPTPFKTITGLELGSGKKFEVLYQPTGLKLRVVTS